MIGLGSVEQSRCQSVGRGEQRQSLLPRQQAAKMLDVDQKRRNRQKRPVGDPPDEPPAELMAGYTPKQQETYLKGLRILGRVATRAHMRRKAAEFDAAKELDGEEG